MAFLCRVSLVFLHSETWDISIWKPSIDVSICVLYAPRCSNNILVCIPYYLSMELAQL